MAFATNTWRRRLSKGLGHSRFAISERQSAAKLVRRNVNLVVVFKLVLALSLMVLLLRNIELGKFLALIGGASISLFVMAVLLLAGGVAINALRWARVMQVLDRPIGLLTAVIGNFEAMFFNQVLPTGMGGDAMRTIRAYDAGASAGFATMSVLIDRALGLWFAAFAICLAPLVASTGLIRTPGFWVLACVSAGVVVGGMAAAVIGPWINAAWLPYWSRPLVALTQAYAQVIGSPSALWRIAVALIVSNALTVLAFVQCAAAVGFSLSIWDALVIMQGMVMASLLPISIGGWGVREGAAIALFAGISVGTEEAAAISIVFGLVLTVVGLLGAAVWFLSGYQRVRGPFGLCLTKVLEQKQKQKPSEALR